MTTPRTCLALLAGGTAYVGMTAAALGVGAGIIGLAVQCSASAVVAAISFSGSVTQAANDLLRSIAAANILTVIGLVLAAAIGLLIVSLGVAILTQGCLALIGRSWWITEQARSIQQALLVDGERSSAPSRAPA